MVSPEQLNTQKPKWFHVCQDCKRSRSFTRFYTFWAAFMATMQVRIGSNTQDFRPINAGVKTHIRGGGILTRQRV